MPGFSAKTVHFPPWPAGAPAPQATLAALGISTLGESAGNSCENGSLSPVACRGTGSTDLSRRTRHSLPPGKCREFPRKRFTFPRGLPGYRLHRPLSPHLPFPPLAISTPRGKCRVFPRKRFTFPRGRQGHRLHRPLWPHQPFPPLGKVPGFSAKTVHFPPQLEWQGRHRSN